MNPIANPEALQPEKKKRGRPALPDHLKKAKANPSGLYLRYEALLTEIAKTKGPVLTAWHAAVQSEFDDPPRDCPALEEAIESLLTVEPKQLRAQYVSQYCELLEAFRDYTVLPRQGDGRKLSYGLAFRKDRAQKALELLRIIETKHNMTAVIGPAVKAVSKAFQRHRTEKGF